MVTAFKKVEGVSDCTIDFAKKTATVTFDPAKQKKDTLADAALKGSRYTASIAQ